MIVSNEETSLGARAAPPNSHEDVDGKVGNNGYPGDRGTSVELSVAKSGGSSVVEDVEELKRLLLDDEEHRVGELPVCTIWHTSEFPTDLHGSRNDPCLHLNCDARTETVNQLLSLRT